MILIFIFLALKSGADRYYLKKAGGSTTLGRELFYYFRPKNIPSLLIFYFNYYLRKLLIILLCFLPSFTLGAVLLSFIRQSRASLTVSGILFAFAVFLFLNGIIFFFRFNSFLFLARYYFASGFFFTYRQLFDFSYGCMEGRRWEVLRKKLSFIGWFISCIFILPVGFVQSYYRESLAALAKDLMEN